MYLVCRYSTAPTPVLFGFDMTDLARFYSVISVVGVTAVICQTQNLGSDLNFGLYRSFGTLKS